mgnify:FL=1
MKFESGDIVRYHNNDEVIGIIVDKILKQGGHNAYRVYWFERPDVAHWLEWEYDLKGFNE